MGHLFSFENTDTFCSELSGFFYQTLHQHFVSLEIRFDLVGIKFIDHAINSNSIFYLHDIICRANYSFVLKYIRYLIQCQGVSLNFQGRLNGFNSVRPPELC